MNKTLKTILSLLLSFLLIVSFYLTVAAFLLKNTMFSERFYNRVVDSADYRELLMGAINNDLLTKSNFSAIPLEVLQAGVDDQLVRNGLHYHVMNTVKFLNYNLSSVEADYPVENFSVPLMEFIEEHAAAEGYEPTEEQYQLLEEVALDSAGIAERHINIVNLNLVKDMSVFKSVHRVLYNLRRLLLPAFFGMLLMAALLALLHRKDWRRGVFFILTSLWLSSALLAVPALVTEIYALPRRLAIDTPYLKFAIDEWLTYINSFIMYCGIGVLLVATVLLAMSFFSQKTLRRRRSSIRTAKQNAG